MRWTSSVLTNSDVHNKKGVGVNTKKKADNSMSFNGEVQKYDELIHKHWVYATAGGVFIP